HLSGRLNDASFPSPPPSFPPSFFKPRAATEIYTLSLHDALPIFFVIGMKKMSAIFRHQDSVFVIFIVTVTCDMVSFFDDQHFFSDRKSTRLNSSHVKISYAVFCLKKKHKKNVIKRADLCIVLAAT